MNRWMKMGSNVALVGLMLCGTVAAAATTEMDDEQVVYVDEPPAPAGNPISAEEICGGFFASQTKLECMRIVNSARFFDDKAVSICKGLFSTDDTLKCLRASKNRTYTQSNINMCKGFFGTKEVIECLETGGLKGKQKKGFSVVQVEVPVPTASAGLSLSQSSGDERRKVVAALKQIEAGNLKTAKRLLREYLEATE